MLMLRKVLDSTAGAIVKQIVRRGWGDLGRPRLHDLPHVGAGKIAVPLQRLGAQPNPIARHGARHKDDASIGQAPNPISTYRDPGDGHEIRHSGPSRKPSRRPSWSHGDSA